MFVRGREYRREEIHRQLGGQRSSGIVTPRAAPVVLLFSSPSGRAYGYRDGWSEDGRWYFYTGEGQRGDMRLVRGNRAIAEHRASGRQLWVFEFTRPRPLPLPRSHGIRGPHLPTRCSRSRWPAADGGRFPITPAPGVRQVSRLASHR